jgi:hypothetical protein
MRRRELRLPEYDWLETSVDSVRAVVTGAGSILYDRDYLGDELPFWVKVGLRRHLIIPTSYETNDNRFDCNSGFRTADAFARYMMDCFDLLYEEGAEGPKMMALNLHEISAGNAQSLWPQISVSRVAVRGRISLGADGLDSERSPLVCSSGNSRVAAEVFTRDPHGLEP